MYWHRVQVQVEVRAKSGNFVEVQVRNGETAHKYIEVRTNTRTNTGKHQCSHWCFPIFFYITRCPYHLKCFRLQILNRRRESIVSRVVLRRVYRSRVRVMNPAWRGHHTNSSVSCPKSVPTTRTVMEKLNYGRIWRRTRYSCNALATARSVATQQKLRLIQLAAFAAMTLRLWP